MNKKNHFCTSLTLVLFLGLAYLSLSGRTASINQAFNQALSSYIQPHLTQLMLMVSFLGEWFIYSPIILLLVSLKKYRAHFGLPMLKAMMATVLSNQLLKNVFQVPRPQIYRLSPASGYSFPSGHSMGAMSFALLLIHFLQQSSLDKKWKRIGSFLALAFALGMGLSRIYLGVHTISDVLAGYLLSFFIVHSMKITRIL